MCGIVIMGCKYPGARDVDMFEELLFADTFRGPHSTGVHSLFQLVDKGEIVTETRKKMLDGPAFIASKFWPEVSEKRVPGATANSVLIKRPFCMIGHNRWATKGGINDANAHPFTHDHITMVHNGTLRDQTILPEHKRFEVDSDNVAYALANWGAEKTIQNLNGAFTLVWHDAKEQTVNIIRNSERPFHLAKTTTGDWFGASEEAMLKWILARQKTPVAIAESFECEVGVQYIFDVSTGKFLPKENVKHTLPTFRYVYQGFSQSSTTYAGYDDDYDYDLWWTERRSYQQPSQTRQVSQGVTKSAPVTDLDDAKTKRVMNALLWDHGITPRIGEKLKFISTDFKNYQRSKYGNLIGYTDTKEYIETICYGIDEGSYRQFADYEGEIVKAVRESGTLYITLTKPVLLSTAVEPPEEDRKEPIADPLVGDTFEFKITGLDKKALTWTGETPGGFKTYGDYFACHSHMAVGDIWIGRSVVCLDKAHRMGSIKQVVDASGKVVGDLEEGAVTRFRVTSINLGTATFQGLTETNIKVSGSVPAEIFMAIGEDWEADVSFRFYDNSYRVMDIRKPGFKSSAQILTEVANMPDDEDVVIVDDEVVRTTATGERFTAKKWEESLASDCSACFSPISFDNIGSTSIIQGHSLCAKCEEKEPPFEVSKPRPPLAQDDNYFICGECKQRKHTAVKAGLGNLCVSCDGKRSRLARPVLSLPNKDAEIGKIIEFTITQLAVGPAFWGKTRTEMGVSGVIPAGKKAKVGDVWKGKIIKKFVDGSYRVEDVSERLTLTVTPCVIKVPQNKTLSNGISVSKELWETKMCKCKMCSTEILWDRADLVALVGGIPVCDACTKLIV